LYLFRWRKTRFKMKYEYPMKPYKDEPTTEQLLIGACIALSLFIVVIALLESLAR